VRMTAPATTDGFEPPDTSIFEWGPLLPGGPPWLTKPILVLFLSALLVCLFFWTAFRNPRLVPRGLQNLGELAYLFVREQIARPILGKHGDGWMPFLLPLFFFIAVLNLMGIVPVLQLPGTSHFAVPLILALTVYGIYIVISIRTQGPVGYLKGIMFPPGLPGWVYVFYAPIELMHHLVLRPFTHSIRLFANMFAGHLLIAFFSYTAYWFLVQNVSAAGVGVGLAGFAMTLVMTVFEMFVQILQAYIFTLLAATYIDGALNPEH
jgi:F-type H+-transporting ATPase subunit a